MRAVTLQEMLDAREARVEAQRDLLSDCGLPLISFTMNIPGPVKNSAPIRRAFDEGLRLLETALADAGLPCCARRVSHAVTGNEFLCAVNAPAAQLKAICTRIEDESPLGRLFDIDVIGRDGRKLARSEERCCLVCGAVGRGCASRRLHSLEELNAAVAARLSAGLLDADAERADELVTRALLDEVATTPKPGLVDRDNSGSHRDMTLETFEKSAAALRGYWRGCFLAGAETAHLPPKVAFFRLRALGRKAETRMLDATGGVNTHKGVIFSLGTICGALGRLWQADERCTDTAVILKSAAALCAKAIAADFAELEQRGLAHTAGEQLYLSSGLKGIRGEAAAGFPSVIQTGLPVLEACLSEGMSRNDAGVVTLMHLIARGGDTNMIKRGGAALAGEVICGVRDCLRADSRPSAACVRAWDSLFIRRNLSPGGCADLLAVSYFLHDWTGA